ncbi:hypothetical protein JCM8547_004101 [Rhodosporidiobolus lusitaniae]
MSLDKLPREVLDQICEEYGKSEDSQNVPTLLSVSLVCKAKLSSARQELYREPFRGHSPRKDGKWLVRLVATLKEHPHLASLVLNLDGLAPLISSSAFDDLQCDLAIVLSSTSYLRHVHLDFSHQPNDPHLISELWVLGFQFAQSTPSLALHLPNYMSRGARVAYTCSDLLIRLTSASTTVEQAMSFLPAKLDCLSSLTILLKDLVDAACLKKLASALTNNRLERFTLVGPGFDRQLMRDANYYLPTLSLANTDGHSTTFLPLLASSCPHLTSLDLNGSTWTFLPSDLVSSSPSSPSSAEQHFLSALPALPNLRYLDLGAFPVRKSKSPFRRLKAYCEVRRVRFTGMGLEEEETEERADEEDDRQDE